MVPTLLLNYFPIKSVRFAYICDEGPLFVYEITDNDGCRVITSCGAFIKIHIIRWLNGVYSGWTPEWGFAVADPMTNSGKMLSKHIKCKHDGGPTRDGRVK